MVYIMSMIRDVFSVTRKELDKSFNRIRALVFDNLIDLSDLDDVDIDFLDTEWGYCVEENDEIILGVTDEFSSKKAFENTLCHEMIHLYQIVSNSPVNHGKTFKSFEKRARLAGVMVNGH